MSFPFQLHPLKPLIFNFYQRRKRFSCIFLTFHFWRFSKWLWTHKKGEIDGWLASNRVEKSKHSERDIITLSRWWRFDFNFWGLLKEFSKCSLASSSSWWWNYGWSTFSMKGGRKFIMKLLRKMFSIPTRNIIIVIIFNFRIMKK